MEIFLRYLIVFLVGGLVCMIGQILIIRTKITSARILVAFELLGVFLQAIGVYDYISGFAKAGVNVPIIGFGASLAKGAISCIISPLDSSALLMPNAIIELTVTIPVIVHTTRVSQKVDVDDTSA